ncbi:Membrane protein, suppressor for copper-sensitivity ScsD [hydrothermal vent metagenome]|jgi:thiol-disulfide isomerase/thioredoxin|uniref:Membrane protein, suppressor for copper-sensitivity ScsD n=1 Tax=hydrothermal vent metagenome TaxID=652676 RepID=A0A1W1D6K3_9ZZZZ
MKFNRPSRKTIMQFMMVILAIFVIRAWQQQDLTQGMSPSFSSKTLTGEIMNSNPLPDQAILIHFWATWCPVCHIENDNIQAVAEDYKTLNIAIQSEDDVDIIKYAKENNLKLDNIINDRSGSLSRLFGVKGTPTSFIVNPKGRIQFVEVGYVTELGLRLRLWWAGL